MGWDGLGYERRTSVDSWHFFLFFFFPFHCSFHFYSFENTQYERFCIWSRRFCILGPGAIMTKNWEYTVNGSLPKGDTTHEKGES